MIKTKTIEIGKDIQTSLKILSHTQYKIDEAILLQHKEVKIK